MVVMVVVLISPVVPGMIFTVPGMMFVVVTAIFLVTASIVMLCLQDFALQRRGLGVIYPIMQPRRLSMGMMGMTGQRAARSSKQPRGKNGNQQFLHGTSPFLIWLYASHHLTSGSVKPCRANCKNRVNGPGILAG